MKKLACLILTVIILGSFTLVSCKSENKSENKSPKKTAVNASATIKEPETEIPTEKPTAAVETVSSSELSKSNYNALVNSYDYLISSYGFEGEVYVTEHGKPIYKKGTGYADKKKKLVNNEYTIFRVASITKQFTAAAILILQDRGKLSVKDTLGKYFPEYKNASKVTIDNVLRMQGGLPDYMNYYSNVASFFPDYNKALKNTSRENRVIIQKNFMGDPMLFNQGDAYKYSNSGYMLLGEIIEMVSGYTYEAFVRKEIFDKLGMNNSGFIEELDGTKENVAKPYEYSKGNLDVFRIKGAAFACGNIYSNAVDLSKWANGLIGGKILSKSALHSMVSDTKHIGYGYGLFIMPGGKAVFHTGNLAPYNSIILMSLGSTKYTCVAMSNSNFYATETLGKNLYSQYASYS